MAASCRRPLPLVTKICSRLGSGGKLRLAHSSVSTAFLRVPVPALVPSSIAHVRPRRALFLSHAADNETQPSKRPATSDWLTHRKSGRTVPTTMHAQASMVLGSSGRVQHFPRRCESSSASREGSHTEALTRAVQAIEGGDEVVVKQLATALSKQAAEQLIQKLSEQNKVRVTADSNTKLVRLEDFDNIDRNQDGVITSQEFERFIRESQQSKVAEPTRQQLWLVAMASSVPFIGFGFMDNAIMILAGEVIEAKLGLAFGITTMAAAAIGNLISDVAGVGLGGTIEVLAARLGYAQPNLSAEQMRMRSTQLMSNLGAALGVAFGCFLGMFPLLFMGPVHHDDDDEEAQA